MFRALTFRRALALHVQHLPFTLRWYNLLYQFVSLSQFLVLVIKWLFCKASVSVKLVSNNEDYHNKSQLRIAMSFLSEADGSCNGMFCDPNADCLRNSRGEHRQCVCRNGWKGDGQTCSGNQDTFHLFYIINSLLSSQGSNILLVNNPLPEFTDVHIIRESSLQIGVYSSSIFVEVGVATSVLSSHLLPRITRNLRFLSS